MIEGLDHLGLVQREEHTFTPYPTVALELEPQVVKLFRRVEEFRIVGLIEHAYERNAPRIAAFLASLVHEDRHVPVHAPGEFGVTASAEYRAGARVGIDQGHVGGVQRNVALLRFQVAHRMSKEHEIGRRRLDAAAAEHQRGELERAVHVGKQTLSILEVVQQDQGFVRRQSAEELFCRLVAGDSRGDQQTDAPARRNDEPGQFRK